MARTNGKWVRPYVSGYRMCQYARSVGSLGITYETTPDAALCDEVKNVVLGQPMINADPLNGFMDNTAAGLHELGDDGTASRIYTVCFGVNAEPAAGDPVFSWPMEQGGYLVENGDGFVTVNLSWAGATSGVLSGYGLPWGYLLHAYGAETGANTAVGVDNPGYETNFGGIFTYHLLSSNGTVTLKAQHADTNSNGSFADITGATTGDIDATSAPVSGMIALGATAEIKRYTRWQLAFNSADTATFIMALHRRGVA